VPVHARVRRVVEFFGGGDEVGAVVGVFVVIEDEEFLARNSFLPVVSFVVGLPDCMVG
jgi:hypothetical protein